MFDFADAIQTFFVALVSFWLSFVSNPIEGGTIVPEPTEGNLMVTNRRTSPKTNCNTYEVDKNYEVNTSKTPIDYDI